jgi:hypothetical protein
VGRLPLRLSPSSFLSPARATPFRPFPEIRPQGPFSEGTTPAYLTGEVSFAGHARGVLKLISFLGFQGRTRRHPPSPAIC